VEENKRGESGSGEEKGLKRYRTDAATGDKWEYLGLATGAAVDKFMDR